MICKFLELTHMFGKKWKIAIIEEIAFGKFEGFNSFLERSNKITPRVLSLELKELESNGFIRRKQGNRKTDYVLTKKGAEAHNLIIQLKKWAMKWAKNTPSDCPEKSCLVCQAFLTNK